MRAVSYLARIHIDSSSLVWYPPVAAAVRTHASAVKQRYITTAVDYSCDRV
jgi:hypothetical protein